MRRAYGTRRCLACGAAVSTSGAAYAAHCRMHVREGTMREERHAVKLSYGRRGATYGYRTEFYPVQPPPSSDYICAECFAPEPDCNC